MRNVAVIYHMFPHYRLPVMKALDSSTKFRFFFFGDDREYEGIRPAASDDIKLFFPAKFRTFGRLFWQTAAVSRAADPKFDAIIFLANPNFVSTWLGAALARLTGKKVLFWAHGWLKPEVGYKRYLRNLFFQFAHVVLVYGERAKRLGRESGFPAERIRTIYNSLDYETSRSVLHEIRAGRATECQPRDLFRENRPIIICTARLTPRCELDILLRAAHLLERRSRPVNILLVGDGPSRPGLESLATELGQNVHFWGACYDESILGQLIFRSDVMVQPGKMGLTVIHSLMYGTPAITHSDMDHQMPEAEAIVSGETGLFFERGKVEDLAAKLEHWLSTQPDREAIREKCIAEVDRKWNPATQKTLIENAVQDLLCASPS